MAGRFDHTGVVGELILVRGVEGRFEQGQIETLWGLHCAHDAPVHGHAGLLGPDLSQAVLHGHHRHRTAVLGGRLETRADGVHRGKRSDGVVHPHHPRVGQLGQPVGHGVEPFCTPGDHLVDPRGAVRLFQRSKLLKQAVVQHKHHFCIREGLPKTTKGPPHEWQTLDVQKLFGRRPAHPNAGAPGDHDDVLLHPLKRAPTAFQSTTSKKALM